MESGLLTKGSYDKSLLTHAGAYQTSGLRTTALLNYYLRSSQMLVWHMACFIHPKPFTVLTNYEKFKRKIWHKNYLMHSLLLIAYQTAICIQQQNLTILECFSLWGNVCKFIEYQHNQRIHCLVKQRKASLKTLFQYWLVISVQAL